MNNLEISGFVYSRPHYANLTEGRVLRFTLKHMTEDHQTQHDRPFTLLNCEYKHPPPEWWHNPHLHQGAHITVQGPVSMLNFFNKRLGEEDKTIKVEITSLVLHRNKGTSKKQAVNGQPEEERRTDNLS